MERRRPTIAQMLDWVLRLAIGGVFIYAGVAKAVDPKRFAQDIDAYQLLPLPAVTAVALYLPWLEIASGACLIVRRLDKGAAALLLGMLGIFIIAAASAWARGIDISCGCFGSATVRTSALGVILRNMLLIGGLVVVVALNSSSPSWRRSRQNTFEPRRTG